MSYSDYAAKLSHLNRKELLKVCRAGGLSAMSCKTNAEIINVLWVNFAK